MFWIREVAGWAFIVLGLVTFGTVYFVLLSNHKFYEAGPMTFIGIFLFRGGIHLLKVAVAARICEQTEVRRPRPASSPRRP